MNRRANSHRRRKARNHRDRGIFQADRADKRYHVPGFGRNKRKLVRQETPTSADEPGAQGALPGTGQWQTVATSPAIVGGQNVVTNEPGGTNAFFRLRRP